jgi:hypothetical protein
MQYPGDETQGVFTGAQQVMAAGFTAYPDMFHRI